MRWPWQKRAQTHVDPNRPHAFRSTSDSGIGALTPVGGGVGRQVADIASANAYSARWGAGSPAAGSRATR
jgi:hypothetical protein